MQLFAPDGATVGDGTATGTILDDDAPPPPPPPGPNLSIDDVTVTEGPNVPASFTVTLSEPVGTEVTVKYRTVPGSATQDTDYYGVIEGTVTFDPFETTASATVFVKDDSEEESSETFLVELFDPVGAAINDGSGKGTILDDDSPPAATARATADDHSVAITRIPPNQLVHPTHKPLLFFAGAFGFVTLRAARHAQGLACPTLRHALLVLDVPDHLPLPRRAQ